MLEDDLRDLRAARRKRLPHVWADGHPGYLPATELVVVASPPPGALKSGLASSGSGGLLEFIPITSPIRMQQVGHPQ
jgi:hypothetical protein